MANPLKGEVALKLGDDSYTLVLDTNAIIEAEAILDRGLSQFDLRRIGTQRALLWAALQRKHPGTSLIAAGEMITRETMKPIGDKLGELIEAAVPFEKDGAAARPPKAGQAGTGEPS